VTARRPVAAFLALAALVVAGCGSSGGVSKNDYVKRLNAAVATLQKSTAAIGPGSSTGAATGLENGAKAMDAAAADFGSITPPNDAKHAHAQIVDGMHKLGGTFRDAAEAARAKDQKKLVKTLTGLQDSPGARELAAASRELSASGFNVQ
jgi:hypothetical protein